MLRLCRGSTRATTATAARRRHDFDNIVNSEVQYFASASIDGGRTFLPNVCVDEASDENRARELSNALR